MHHRSMRMIFPFRARRARARVAIPRERARVNSLTRSRLGSRESARKKHRRSARTHRDLGRLEGRDGAGEGGGNAGHFRRFDVCVNVCSCAGNGVRDAFRGAFQSSSLAASCPCEAAIGGRLGREI